jgi:hypothetical protein
MNALRWVVLLLSIALVTVACDGDSIETTTTTTEATTTSTARPSTSTTEIAKIQIPEAGPASCFYLDGYFAVEEGQAEVAIEALGGFDVELEPVSVAEVLGDSNAAEPLDAALDLVATSVDSFDVASTLIEAEITAGPVYAVGLAGHWKFGPGTEPISRPDAQIDDPGADLGRGVIAVVDSGIVDDPQIPDDLPDWMSPGHVLYDPGWDSETVGTAENVASHGTFVTSLIRQLAPEYRVAFASAHAVSPDLIVQNEDTLPAGLQYLSTELHVAEAIIRLTQRPELDAENVAALNLSLGTYTCDPGSDPTLLTTMAAMGIWFGEFPNSTVFAAAGNEPYEAPFWPAGLSSYQLDPTIDPAWVRGVAAVNENAEEVVWSQAASTAGTVATRPPQRQWVTDLSPGCDLLGLRGGMDDSGATIVAWSGSSFATAVTAALDTTGVPPSSTGATAAYDYTAPGLSFERLGSCTLP